MAGFIHNKGYRLFAKDDAQFIDAVFRLALLHMDIQPHINARMFLSTGFIGKYG